jgi:hypothetical protein
MVMMENLADTPARALGDFASAFGGANADVLAGRSSAFADIAGGLARMQCDEVARAFANALGGCSSALGGSFANVAGAPADVATGAALMARLPGGGLHSAGRLRRRLSLAVLTECVRAANGKYQRKQCDGGSWKWVPHGFNLPPFRFRCAAGGFPRKDSEIGEKGQMPDL